MDQKTHSDDESRRRTSGMCVCVNVPVPNALTYCELLWLSRAPHPVAVVPDLSLGKDEMIRKKSVLWYPSPNTHTLTHTHTHSTCTTSTNSTWIVASRCIRLTRRSPPDTNEIYWCGVWGHQSGSEEGRKKNERRVKKKRRKKEKLLLKIEGKGGESIKQNQAKVYADLNYNPGRDKNKQNNPNRAQWNLAHSLDTH